MQKYKFGLWHEFCVLRLIFVLVLGLCANLWASDKDVPSQHKLNWMKHLQQLPREAKTALPPDLWVSQKPQESAKIMTGTGAISGHVTKAVGGSAIPGVMITAHQLACPSYSSFAFSGSDGFYVITNLPPGMYRVNTSNIFNDSNFVDVWWKDSLNEETADTVKVFSNDTTKNIDFSLRVGGKITGTVTLPGAFYVSGLIFAIDTTHRAATYSSNVFGVGSPTTYFVKRLPTGTYKLRTMMMTGNDISMEHPMSYIDVYYDGKSSWATADPVSVTLGSTTSNKNFTPSLGGTIQGLIAHFDTSLKDIRVYGFYVPNLEWFSSASTDSDGNYTLTGLRSGNWKIFALGDTTYAFQWWWLTDTWSDADTVYITAPETTISINFVLDPGGSISGHVYDLGGLPLSGCDVTAYDTSFLMWGITAKSDTSSATGSYKITGLGTGYYKVEASPACGDTQWYDHKSTREQATPVHVTMPSNTPNIDFNVSTAVEDEDDQTTRRPTEFELSQNYPNPFNPGTEIEYALKKTGHVTLYIYNVLGEKVKTLLDQDQPAGFYRMDWDGKNDDGKLVSSGIYLYKLEVNGFSEAKKMLLLK